MPEISEGFRKLVAKVHEKGKKFGKRLGRYDSIFVASCMTERKPHCAARIAMEHGGIDPSEFGLSVDGLSPEQEAVIVDAYDLGMGKGRMSLDGGNRPNPYLKRVVSSVEERISYPL